MYSIARDENKNQISTHKVTVESETKAMSLHTMYTKVWYTGPHWETTTQTLCLDKYALVEVFFVRYMSHRLRADRCKKLGFELPAKTQLDGSEQSCRSFCTKGSIPMLRISAKGERLSGRREGFCLIGG